MLSSAGQRDRVTAITWRRERNKQDRFNLELSSCLPITDIALQPLCIGNLTIEKIEHKDGRTISYEAV